MADPREVFPILSDPSNDAGLSWHKVNQGDALAGKNAGAVLTARDAANNLRYLKLDSADRLLVSSNAGDTACLSANGELAAGNLALTLVTNASIDLQTDHEYEGIGFVVNCRRDSLYQLIWLDDVTETVLAEIVTGAGAFTVVGELHCLAFTSGSTGVQKLYVKAKNFEVLSSLRATVTVTEIQ